MQKPKGRHVPRPTSAPRPGEVARAKGRTLNSCRIGALPIVDRILERMRLEEFLRSYLPAPIDAAGSLPRSALPSCSRTCSSAVNPSTASENGRRVRSRGTRVRRHPTAIAQ